MFPVFTYISARLKKLDQKRAAYHDRAILALEKLYLRRMQTGKPTLKDALAATDKVMKAHFFIPDLYFILAGILVIVFSSGVFSEPGVDYGFILPFLVASSGLCASLVAIALAYITVPMHFLFRANIWLMTGVHVVLTSVVFSAIQPHYAALFLEEGVAPFSALIHPVLIFFGLAEFYMLFRLNSYINIDSYVARHILPDIESHIPPKVRGPLISMSSQDHYLEIVTENGSHLIRQTMAKAVTMVPEDAGLRIHRSHWVAFNAIVKMEKTAEKYTVLLKNGQTLPVGKSKVEELQAFLDSR